MAKKIDDMTMDEILGYLVKTQGEKIEKMLKAQKEKAEEKMKPQKEKAEETIRSFVSLLMNQDVQRHFVKAGVEFLAGIEELIRNAPLPDFVKETMDKACDSKDSFVKDFKEERKAEKKSKDKKMKKIDVE